MTSRWEWQTKFRDDGENVCIVAAALDPRFRKLKFLQAEDIVKVHLKVQSLALEEKRRQRSKHLNIKVGNRMTQSVQKGSQFLCWILYLVWIQMSTVMVKKTLITSNLKILTVRNEILLYFGEQAIPKNENPLKWWKENEASFPTFTILAKCYLSMPATSTPSERLFSVAEQHCD